MAQHHDVSAASEHIHWGFFDAALDPVVEIDSGDTVTIHTISGVKEVVPKDEARLLPEHKTLLETQRPRIPGHILTGPVAVKGVRAGEVLEVRIKDVQLRQDWGWNVIRPLAGALPGEFDETRLLHIEMDREAMVAELPWGRTLPLRPFFGVMGNAPPPGWGVVSSIPPQVYGGNLDNKELIPGATLYLPVFNDGALFSCGDGHAVQGDGEVCVTAIETAMSGTFELVARPDMSLERPRAETPSHYVAMGIHEDLDEAARQALRDMIALIQEKANLSREDAYTLCSLAADLRVTQIVNGNKGVHAMLAKSHLHD